MLLNGLDRDVIDLDVGRRVGRSGITALERLGNTDDGAVQLVVPLLWRARLHRLQEIHRRGQDLVLDFDQAHRFVADVL